MPPSRLSIPARFVLTLSVALSATLAVSWVRRNRRLIAVSDITAGENFDYPELRAHVYYAQPSQALDAARHAIASAEGFRIAANDPDQFHLMAEVKSGRADGRCDEITINALPLGPSHTRVVIRSRSRVARPDFGRNAQHIRVLQHAMDDLLVGG